LSLCRQQAMGIEIRTMKLTTPVLPFLCLLMLSCSASVPPEYGIVDWFVSNATGTSMTLMVYDKICKRRYNRVRLGRTGQTSITTCNDSESRADIRYRPTGIADIDNPWFDAHLSQNRSLIVR